LRKAIEAHGGYMFKHTGDGVCAAFASPKCAIDTAVAAQQALELPVRMGIATGEAELRDGDYFGTVLNRAARVMAAGHGGQILVADSTAVLLSGIDLLDLGPRRLRDVSAPVGVFQVRAPGLRTEFPSLRGVDSNPGNLRPAITSLIGRDAEVCNLQAALRSHRLVTLAGVGGVGKTRLAVEVAMQLADEFVDGVWFFELAAVADPAAVPRSSCRDATSTTWLTSCARSWRAERTSSRQHSGGSFSVSLTGARTNRMKRLFGCLSGIVIDIGGFLHRGPTSGPHRSRRPDARV
jgi:hypothetical protein